MHLHIHPTSLTTNILGVIYGDIWYQGHPQTQQTYLHTDLRHNLGTEFDDLQIHYLATYTFNIQVKMEKFNQNTWYGMKMKYQY